MYPNLNNFPQLDLSFGGSSYDPAKDKTRLTSQLLKVKKLMSDGNWRTLRAIERATGYPQSSISARLRDLRKEKFGNHTVEKRRSSENGGTFEYCVKVNNTDR